MDCTKILMKSLLSTSSALSTVQSVIIQDLPQLAWQVLHQTSQPIERELAVRSSHSEVTLSLTAAELAVTHNRQDTGHNSPSKIERPVSVGHRHSSAPHNSIGTHVHRETSAMASCPLSCLITTNPHFPRQLCYCFL
ncbi:hypothetical protein KC19_6G066600 [Ceratodon purpureus]|uniref:Uncharacterized protein n=1 Tax=Ceratodon purpureus TaxID=3225 RepID=A0A8T0HBA3_CERPU|nr:hypothetical protein KC19_6G066600 [Ceratodon purpureus]